MSNHFSSDNLKFPGDDARLDFTDLFVFKSSDHPDRTVLITDWNPFMTGPAFHPDAVYRINIDTDGDAHADAAFTFTFSELENGVQTGTAYYATGSQARQPEPAGQVLTSSLPVGFDAAAQPVQAGPVRLFAGVRSDPFFADAEGAFHGFQWTGHDTFAGKNILSIAAEVPNDMLGDGPVIGVWATVSVRRDDGVLEQTDRGGHPTINPFLNPDGEKNLYNSRQPADDVANYLGPWSTMLEDNGYPPRGGHGGRPAGAAGHPALRPHPARRLPQRPPSPPTTSTACALPGRATARSARPASSRTTTCWPSSPTSARPTLTARPGLPRADGTKCHPPPARSSPRSPHRPVLARTLATRIGPCDAASHLTRTVLARSSHD
jgi:hypothetical protein